MLPLLGVLGLLLQGAGHQPLVRPPSQGERVQIVAAVRATWRYESTSQPYHGHVRPLSAQPHVVGIRVSTGNPLYATAAVDLVDARGRVVHGAAVILLGRVRDKKLAKAIGAWVPVTEPVPSFPRSCTAATPSELRALLCPSPWAVLHVREPRSRPAQALDPRLRTTDLHSVDWSNVTLPGATCGADEPIRLRHGEAAVYSVGHPWWPAVVVDTGRAVDEHVYYGDLTGDGHDEAALDVVCSNGGGTADGQLAFSSVIFTAVGHSLRVIGIVTPRQPLNPNMPHVPIVGKVKLERGRLISSEYWYGRRDGTCCASGRATTTWSYTDGKLRPARTIVTRRPVR
jgi:hypothetical protein